MDTKKVINRILLITGFFILILFLTTVDFKQGLLSIKQLGIMLIALLALVFLNLLVKAWRWKILLQKVTMINIHLPFSFKSIIAGVAAGSFVPGRIELAKPLLMKSHYNVPISHSLSALGIERVLDLFSLLLIALLTFGFIPAQKILPQEILWILVLLLITGTMMVVFFPQSFITIFSKIIKHLPGPQTIKERGMKAVQEMIEGFTILKNKSFLSGMILLSFLANGIEVLRFYLLLMALGIDSSLTITGFVFASSIIIGVLTMIPGGIGITELSAVGILGALVHSGEGVIKTAVLIDRFMAYYVLLLIGAIILILLSNKREK
ncbi:flippase-like domain-containing protein [Candidatus Woesearchaeota archaeon]|nr:flippase-like domain-containing protein [Candidatus Woesearchaeota archaeon]